MTYKKMFGALTLTVTMQGTAFAQEAPMSPLRPDQVAFRALYKELVETNTTLSAGSCTLLAQRIAAHLRAAGFTDKDITLFSVPDHPKEGGLVAVLAGSSSTAKPMLLLGHLDVVEAKREDWTRDPFTLIEENGYFYGRGAADMKAMDATWIDSTTSLPCPSVRPPPPSFNANSAAMSSGLFFASHCAPLKALVVSSPQDRKSVV